jgi:dTMP kinase
MPSTLEGVFVVVEGPNGVGKTTVARAITQAARTTPVEVVSTAEPTDTALGRAIRSLVNDLPPTALALACAADRQDHIARTIQPALTARSFVVCDRFVPSSLVLQRLDGMEVEAIWHLNRDSLRPTLTAYLEDDPTTIAQRLDARGRKTRFEERWRPERELEYYREAYTFLASKSWRQMRVDCRDKDPPRIAAEIISAAEHLSASRTDAERRRGSSESRARHP